jgi:uncharacterized membrane protein YozB (DUF420 family)
MGLFNPAAPFLTDLNLLFQIMIFIFLAIGLSAKFVRRYLTHGTIMTIAVILNATSIFAVMVPAFLSSPAFFELNSRFEYVTLPHMILGSLVEALGIFLVVNWMLSIRNIQACIRRKRVMLVTISLWLVNILIGVYVYGISYLGL